MNRLGVSFRIAATAFLAGVLWWGSACTPKADRTGEAPPAASSSPVAGRVDSSGTRCAAHGVPASLCYLCDPARREASRLWCAEHARYEDRCWICHPELRDAARMYCEEHSLYEDECFFCHPELAKPPETAPADARSGLAPTGGDLECREHGVPEAECGICHPELTDGLEPGEGLKVRFASPDAAAIAGLRTSHPRIGETGESLETFAELVFDQNAFTQVVSPVTGTLHSVDVDLGQRVGRGAVLARVESGVVGEAVSRMGLARQTLERERSLRAGRVTSERELEGAEAAYQGEYQALRSLGFSDEDLTTLGSDPSQVAVLPVRAPFAGEIVERNAVPGSLVEAGTSLFALTDRSTMWAMLSIPERHLAAVRAGQTVELRLDGFPDELFTGTLTWVAAQVDGHTRLSQARAEFPNPKGRLRARMFARARILTSDSASGVLVPSSAVQRINDRTFVFLKVAPDLYEARRVALDPAGDGELRVRAGLLPGDELVVDGSFFVKSQLLISRLGAGCVD